MRTGWDLMAMRACSRCEWCGGWDGALRRWGGVVRLEVGDERLGVAAVHVGGSAIHGKGWCRTGPLWLRRGKVSDSMITSDEAAVASACRLPRSP